MNMNNFIDKKVKFNDVFDEMIQLRDIFNEFSGTRFEDRPALKALIISALNVMNQDYCSELSRLSKDMVDAIQDNTDN